MGVVKLKNEKKLMIFFIIASIVIFVISLVFLLQSVKKDELGGSFLTAMLLFISGYGMIIFSSRIIRYNFVSKLQKAVIEEEILDISLLSEKFKRSSDKIEKELLFLINNGYLSDYEIVDDRLINIEAEKQRLEKLRAEAMQSKTTEAQVKKPRKTIHSEKCPNCGAKVKFEDGIAECPYCGNSLKKA